LTALALGIAAALAAATGSETRQRQDKLENSILAPCCWAEPISIHRSDVAVQMRAEIARFLGEGKTDREILDYYKARYGERVLVEPEGAKWWWMTLVPVLMLAAGLVVAVLVLKRWIKPLPAS
jgi:cytochrome c-type biogenesis protein CcmH